MPTRSGPAVVSLAPFPPRLSAILLLALAAPLGAITITVDTVSDAVAADGSCSLPEAIAAVNGDLASADCPAGGAFDRIVFDVATPATILLTADLPEVTKSVRVSGPGAALLTLDGAGAWGMFRFVPASSAESFYLDGLTITRGYGVNPGFGGSGGLFFDNGREAVVDGVVFRDNFSENAGGGMTIDRAALLEITGCWFDGNEAAGPGGGGGLGAFDVVEARISRSTFSGNVASHENASGGGLRVSRAEATIDRVTVSGNASFRHGGGISLSEESDVSTMRIVSSTIVGNFSDADLDGDGDGSGLRASVHAPATIEVHFANTVVAGNVHGSSGTPEEIAIDGATLLSDGFNWIGANAGVAASFPAGMPNLGHDYVGTAAAPIDPELTALAANGSPVPSHRPTFVPPSPVIDVGSCPDEPADQRGFGSPATGARIVGLPSVPDGPGSDGCDVGSFEVAAAAISSSGLFANGFEEGHALRWSAEIP